MKPCLGTECFKFKECKLNNLECVYKECEYKDVCDSCFVSPCDKIPSECDQRKSWNTMK